MTDLTPMNAKELMAALGIKHSTFFAQKRRGHFTRFLVTHPIGTRIYSRALVEQHLRGETLTVFGRGARIARRAHS